MPLLAEYDLGHYDEFRRFLVGAFDLDRDPFGPPGRLVVEERAYDLTFIGRSCQAFPAAVEIGALVAGLEPLDETVADDDLWAILQWLVDGVGGEWSMDALTTTGRIYRTPAATRDSTRQELS